jgi:hypothetical protein
MIYPTTTAHERATFSTKRMPGSGMDHASVESIRSRITATKHNLSEQPHTESLYCTISDAFIRLLYLCLEAVQRAVLYFVNVTLAPLVIIFVGMLARIRVMWSVLWLRLKLKYTFDCHTVTPAVVEHVSRTRDPVLSGLLEAMRQDARQRVEEELAQTRGNSSDVAVARLDNDSDSYRLSYSLYPGGTVWELVVPAQFSVSDPNQYVARYVDSKPSSSGLDLAPMQRIDPIERAAGPAGNFHGFAKTVMPSHFGVRSGSVKLTNLSTFASVQVSYNEPLPDLSEALPAY